jgi:hypothetical protein
VVAHNPSSKACASCGRTLLLNEFPKKGPGRRGHNCNACHNAGKRAKRRKNAVSKWSLSVLPVRDELIGEESGAFIETLFNALRTHGYFGREAAHVSVEEILMRESSVDTLLGTKEIP